MGLLLAPSADSVRTAISARAAGIVRAVALAAVIILVTAAVVRLHERYIAVPPTCCQDHQHYLAMAGGLPEHPEAANVSPFTYRILSPAIVDYLPTSPRMGFHLLTTAALFGSLVLLYILLRDLYKSEMLAAMGVLLASGLYWLVEYPQVNYALVDPLSFLLCVAFLLAMYRRAWLICLMIITLAVLNKETALLLVPVTWVFVARTGFNDWRPSAAMTLAAVFAYVACRLLVDADSGDSFQDLLVDVASDRYASPSRALQDVRLYFLPTWGPMLLVLVISPRAMWDFGRSFPELIALFLVAHLQLLIANDTERLLIYGFVPVIAAVTWCLHRLVPRPIPMLLLVATILGAQYLYFDEMRVTAAAFVTRSSSFSPPRSLETETTIFIAAIAGAIAVHAAIRTRRAVRHGPPNGH